MNRFLALSALICLLAGEARAQNDVPLVADLSNHLIAITTGFSGTDVLLFGATDGPGDIAVVVRGPGENEVIRRKGRKGPVWVNTDQVAFREAPSYYRVASSRPLDEFAPQTLLARYQIGIDNIRINTLPDTALEPKEVADFRKALVRLKTEANLYDQGLGAINFMSNRLFRTELHFPSNVPTGTYLVEVYLFRDGDVTSAEIIPLNISQVGMSADVFDFAHNLAPLYGLVSILLAASAGWVANAAFRRT